MKRLFKCRLILLSLFVALALVYPVPLKEVEASPSTVTLNSRAFVAYRDNSGTPTTSSPKERSFGAGATWTAEAEMPTAGSPVRWVRVAYSTNTSRFYEKIVVTQSDDGWLDAYVWNSTAWLVTNNIGNASTLSVRGFDIAYEKTRGRAILVYGITSPLFTGTTTLRPNAAGDLTEWDTLFGAATHWEAVDEGGVLGDGDTSYVSTGTVSDRDLFNIQDITVPTDYVITNVRVHAVAKREASGAAITLMVKTYGTNYFGASQGITGSYVDYYTDWATNPNTALTWTDAEIDALQAGVQFTGTATKIARVTQVYVEVTYGLTRDLAYRIWDGSSWSTEYYLDDTGHTGDITYYWIELAARPTSGSNEITLVALDGTDQDVNGWVWGGTSWSVMKTLTDAVGVTTEALAVAYETGGKAWAIYGNGTQLSRRNHFGGAWAAWGNWTSVGGTPAWITAKSDPASNRIMVTCVDGLLDLNMVLSNEDTTWTTNPGGFAEDADVESATTRVADFDWEPTGSKGLLTYGDLNIDPITYQTYNAVANTWGTRSTYAATGVTDQQWHQSRRDPRGVGKAKIMIGVLDDLFDITLLYWDGANFAEVTDISDSTVATYECFEIEYMVYIPSSATMRVVPASITTGSPFSVNITVEGAFDFYGWEFKLNHTYTILTPTTVAVGNFLNLTVGTANTYGNVLNKTDTALNARVWATQTITGDRQGAMGNGKLATISYSLDLGGTSPLNLLDTELIGYNYTGDKSLYYIDHIPLDGSVTSTLPVPEFPLGAAMEISLIAAIIYIWWIRKKKIKTPTIPR